MSILKRKDYTYDELKRIGQLYYNDTNFCSVIAISVACRVAYGQAKKRLAAVGRQHRKGVRESQIHVVVEQLGCKLERIGGYDGTQVRTIASKLPSIGTFMILVRGHVLTLKDGVIQDWSGDTARRILNIHHVTLTNT